MHLALSLLALSLCRFHLRLLLFHFLSLGAECIRLRKREVRETELALLAETLND
jgi:hypothetical protein